MSHCIIYTFVITDATASKDGVTSEITVATVYSYARKHVTRPLRLKIYVTIHEERLVQKMDCTV